LAHYREWFGEKAGAAIYEEAQRQAQSHIKAQACANHILEVASNNAKQQFKDILAKVQFENAVIHIQQPTNDACPTQSV
jgi:hypothetical protein